MYTLMEPFSKIITKNYLSTNSRVRCLLICSSIRGGFLETETLDTVSVLVLEIVRRLHVQTYCSDWYDRNTVPDTQESGA